MQISESITGENSEFILEKSHLKDKSNVFTVDKIHLNKVLNQLYSEGYTHLSTVIGFQQNGNFVVDYPISSPDPNFKDLNTRFIRTILPSDAELEIDTVSNIFPGSDVYEKEISELLGITFNGIENGKLLLPDDFPEKVYPLRKDVSTEELIELLEKIGVGKNGTMPMKDSKDYVISIGPQHPTHKEPIRFQFFIKGENIESVDLRLGFNHRGIEKALEQNTWVQNLYLIERICGICSAAHQLAYVETAERIWEMVDEIPDRAKWMRTLISELERIHSHILWYGVLAHDGGYDMMFHVTWRDRELVMDILERITGNRVNYSIETIGGIRKDIDDETISYCLKQLKSLKKKTLEHYEILQKEKSFVKRLQDVGPLSYHEAIKMNTVGPTARASGVNYDLRKTIPYAAYKEIPFETFHQKTGDVYAGLIVRLDETVESINMCVYILENLPKGDIAIPFRGRIPEGSAHTRIEAPRGEDIHYIISDGGKNPVRHKVRAPTLANITSLLHRFKGMQVADIPLIIRLIDPCIGCMERVTFVDLDSGKIKELQGDELIARSNKAFRTNNGIRIFEV
ncbi:MAG: Formate hydrogenlyase subunit 5 precursor [Candidatus Heimdallarchaeota archaeon LC_2]|nr:MAG: Formate hydrogenlyase subunit 5 precursor [Candidatus Heimdallarchaeota archaeon LC_2]